MDFAGGGLVQRQQQPVCGANDPALGTSISTTTTTHDDSIDNSNIDNDDSYYIDGITTPTKQSNSSIGSPSTSDDLDFTFSTPPPMPAFTHPPSPPRPAYNLSLEEYAKHLERARLAKTSTSSRSIYEAKAAASQPLSSKDQPCEYKRWFRAQLPDSSSINGPSPDDATPRRPLTSIAGTNRCLWPPETTFLTRSSGTSKQTPFLGISSQDFSQQSTSNGITTTTYSSFPQSGNIFPGLSSEMSLQKQHNRLDSFKNSVECLMDLQPRRKARRTMDGGPYFKEKNDRMVASHVQKLIQEAVEDGVGEVDLSNLDLTDLPPEIRDLNFAIVYNQRGSFALSKNRLKLFLSFNQLVTIPIHVFELHNLSVLSLRNNNIKKIPPEIGLLFNLVELSIGGNLLEYLPSQITLLPKLHILTIHPNPFLACPEPESGMNELNGAENQQQQQQQQQQHHQQQQQQESSEDMNNDQQDQQRVQQSFNNDIEMSTIQHEPELDSEQSFNNDNNTVNASLDQSIEQPRYSPSIHTHNTALRTNIQLPPHRIIWDKFPQLTHLAGNVILKHMNCQDSKIRDEGRDRPRKDSKFSIDDNEVWPEDSQHISIETRIENKVQDTRQSRKQPYKKKERIMFSEEIFKEQMTPYLFSNFKRAQANNRCAGCQRQFWKSCRIVIVWQDVLGQKRVPVRWKGCGIGTCPGVPESLWPVQTNSAQSDHIDRSPSSSTSPRISSTNS